MSSMNDDTCHNELKYWDGEVAHLRCPHNTLLGCHVSGEGDIIS